MSGLRPPRAPYREIEAARQVAALLRQRSRKLGLLQERAALLKFAAEWPGIGHRRDGSKSLAEIDELLREVEAESRALLADISPLPAELATHGRVVDTYRALESLALQLRSARSANDPAASP